MTGLRVAVAHPFPDLYGADRMLLRTLEGVRDAGHEVVVVVPEHGPMLDELDRLDLPWRLLDAPVLRRALLRPKGLAELAAAGPRGLREIRRWLRAYRPDVLYVSTLTLPLWLVAARLERVPSVCHVREAEDAASFLVGSALATPLGLANDVIANSRHTAAFLRRHFPPVGKKTTVVYNGMDFGPIGTRDRTALGRPARLVLVGRLNARKGQDLAIDALARLVPAADVHLDLVGSAFRGYEWYEDSLRDRAASLGLGDRVHLHGFQHDQRPWFDGADIAVVPSRVEPFGNVAVEAMSVGCPTVVARAGGLVEIVDHGRTGLVVAPDDAAGLADAVRSLLDDDALRSHLGAEGAAEVRRRFGVARYQREVVAVIEAAAARVAGKVRP